MKTKLIYIHGLGSDATSRKYILLKKILENKYECECLEWGVTTDIKTLLNNYYQINAKRKHIIIGDSTGANFALQLRELFGVENTQLILLSPLLNVEKRIATFEFPLPLKDYLVEYQSVKNALVVYSDDDEIIDQSFIKNIELSNVQLLEVNDGHRLPKFETYINKIISYILSDR